MFSLTNPSVLVILLISLVGSFTHGYFKGYDACQEKMQIEIAKANSEARQVERVMTEKLNETSHNLLKTNDELNQKNIALTASIRDGSLRFPASCSHPAQDASTASGNRETNTKSERQALEDIAAIANDGDKAINQLNACIDAYNQVRDSQ